jgi:hypothetical protein
MKSGWAAIFSGEWTVSLLYGRTGRGGQEVRHAGSDAERLRRVIRESLIRRLSAPKRIGCSYRLTGLNAAKGIDVDFWLSADTLSGFAR